MLERSVPLVIQRTGQYTLHFPSPPGILSFAAVAGKKEAEGPLGKNFDAVFDDTTLGTDSFEKAESALQGEALLYALKKAGLQPQDLSLLLAGDLLNQCISSTFGLREFGIPFLGLYGACSTMALSLGLTEPQPLPPPILPAPSGSSACRWSTGDSGLLPPNGQPPPAAV